MIDLTCTRPKVKREQTLYYHEPTGRLVTLIPDDEPLGLNQLHLNKTRIESLVRVVFLSQTSTNQWKEICPLNNEVGELASKEEVERAAKKFIETERAVMENS